MRYKYGMVDDAPPVPTPLSALTELQIATLVTQYKREMARYEKAGALVSDRLRRELRQAGIKHMVSSRPKHPDDLAEKLRRKSTEKPLVYSWDALREDLGSVVTDLAGCRVVVYATDDELAVGKMVAQFFAQPSVPGASVARRGGVDEPYWATHALVHPYADKDARDATVDGAICELQIVTVAAHLFNEIEHDITYKQRDAGLHADPVERQLLDEIRGVARVADRLVSALLEHRAGRREDVAHVIRDAEDLKYALWAWAGRRVDGVELQRLLNLLERSLESVTVAALHQLGSVDEVIAEGRRRLADADNNYDEVTQYTVGLLAQFGPEIHAVARTWRGPRTALRRAIDLALKLESEQNAEEL